LGGIHVRKKKSNLFARGVKIEKLNSIQIASGPPRRATKLPVMSVGDQTSDPARDGHEPAQTQSASNLTEPDLSDCVELNTIYRRAFCNPKPRKVNLEEWLQLREIGRRTFKKSDLRVSIDP